MEQSLGVPAPPTEPVLLRADRALVGEDLEVLEPASLLVDGGAIVEIEPASPGDARRIDLPGTTLLPGFIDAHVHMGFARPQEVLFGGVTTVRDLAWPVDEIFPLVRRSQEPGFRGPSVIAAGQMLTVPNGYPTRAQWAPPGTGRVLHDQDEAVEAVQDMAERGACVIKVAVVGYASATMGPDMLRAIVETAHSLSLGVTGHVRGLAELDIALEAGIDELAHMLLTDEVIPDGTVDRMVEAGLTIVPTLAIRADRELEVAVENVGRFAAAGGRIVYGTDLGNTGVRPGIDPTEVRALARAGLDARSIIASATAGAARALGLQDRGAIAPGRTADLIAVDGAPTEDIENLFKICFVMRGGHIYLQKSAR